MERSTVLVVIDKDCSDASLKGYINSIPEAGVHLSFLVVGTAAPLPVWAYGSAPYGPVVFPEDWHQQYQATGKAVTEKAEYVEQTLLRAKAEGDVRSVFCEPVALDEAVAAHATLSDLVFLDPALSMSERLFEAALFGVLFQSPVGVVLNSSEISPVLATKHPFVAWDESQPAVRAVHRALPILKQAEKVTIAVFDPDTDSGSNGGNPGSDLATWLSRHGCNVTVQQYPSGDREIGTCIQDKATETGADLIIMGAYSHSRFREQLLGGTTQTLIEQTRHRVLLAH